MAENRERGAQHLTSLDIDISGIAASLEEAAKQIEQFSLETGRKAKINLSDMLFGSSADGQSASMNKFSDSYVRGMENAVKSTQRLKDEIRSLNSMGASDVVSDALKKFNPAEYSGQDLQELRSLLESIKAQIEETKGTVDSISISTDKVTGGIRAQVDYTTEQNAKLTEYYNTVKSAEEEETKFILEKTTAQKNYADERKRQQDEELRLQKEIDSLYAKGLNDIDIEIYKREQAAKTFSAQLQEQMKGEAERERQQAKQINNIDLLIKKREEEGKRFSAQLKEQMQLQQKESDAVKTTINQLTTLANSYDNLSAKARRAGKDGIAEEADKNAVSIRKMIEALKSGGMETDVARQEFEKLKQSLNELGIKFTESGGHVESFLKRFKDKVGWMTAYQMVNQLARAFKDAILVIKETEDAVIELKRVLSEDISANVMSDALYETAYEYGRTFEEVSEVATKFAQAGYDWNSVMEMTRGTMLALNTAELDVMQSTQGLIAIMSQWNLTAADFESIIDRVNITADKFPVTSEKIVAALQRASGSAKNANITFEETIGIITAMAKSTGRSGENIGTALNSLIVYTTKASSLDTFAKLSDQMDAVVQKYKTGAVSIFQVWQQLSEEINNLSDKQQGVLEEMFSTDEYQQFAEELATEATAYTNQIEQVYGAAGNYRRNYFIALLQDMHTAQDAIENMADAEGYSAAENTKYMESLTANYNQLKVAVQELAVQLGEAGLLDIMKWAVESATGVAQLTKTLGGLHTILTAVGSTILIIKAQKISKSITDFASSLKSAITALVSVRSGIVAVDIAEKGVISTNTLLQASFGWIGVVGLAVSGLIMVINGANAAIDEMNAKSRESALAQTDEAKAISELKKEYAEIVAMQTGSEEKTKALTEFKDKLAKKYRDEADAIRELNGARADEIDFLDEEYERNIRNAYIDVRSQYGMAVDALTNQSKKASIMSPTGLTKNDKNIIESILGTDVKNAGQRGRYEIGFNTQDLQEQVNLLYDILDQEDLSKQAEAAINRLLSEKKKLLEESNAIYKEYAETVAMRYLLEDELQDKIKEAADSENLEDRKRLYEDIVEQIQNTVVGEEAQVIAIEIVANQLGIVEEKMDDIADASERVWGSIKDDIAAAAKSIEGFNAAIDSFQSGYDAVLAAMEEFNEYGYLSLDTIQQFVALGPDYVSLLNITASGVSLNKDKLAELIDKQKENVQSMIQQTTYAGLLEIAEKYLAEATDDVGDSAAASISPASQFGAALLQLAEDCLQVEYSAERAGAAIRSMFSDSAISPSNLSRMQGEMLDYIDTMRGVMNAVNSFTYESPAWSKGAQTAANNAAKAAQSAAKESEKAQKEQTAALKKELEAQKKAIKERYDAEIAALKEVQSENDRLAKQEEYYRKRREMLNNIEKYATRSGVEYREKEAEERQRLAELDSDWQRTLEKWSIDDQIKELERLRDAEIKAIDAQIEKITEAATTAISGIADTYAATNQSMLDGYRNNYLTPIIDDSEKAFENISDRLLDINKETARKIMDVYGENFIGPMELEFTAMGKKIQELSSAAAAFIGPVQQSVADLKNMEFRVSLNNRQAGASTYNNSTSNTYANIYSNSSRTSSPSSSLFLKP